MEMWPRRRTVSKGSLKKSSARESANVAMEEDAGVRIGSMWREERRTSGALVASKGGRVEWRRVIGRRDDGQIQDGRARREGRRARGPEEMGVRIRLWHVSLCQEVSIASMEPTACVSCLSVLE
jgi:hypothetical protein